MRARCKEKLIIDSVYNDNVVFYSIYIMMLHLIVYTRTHQEMR